MRSYETQNQNQTIPLTIKFRFHTSRKTPHFTSKISILSISSHKIFTKPIDEVIVLSKNNSTVSHTLSVFIEENFMFTIRIQKIRKTKKKSEEKRFFLPKMTLFYFHSSIRRQCIFLVCDSMSSFALQITYFSISFRQHFIAAGGKAFTSETKQKDVIILWDLQCFTKYPLKDGEKFQRNFESRK